jgi:hypothetical protein
VLRVALPPDHPLQPGPAGLFCHWHDEHLWNQRSFIVRGQLAQDGRDWLFTPLALTPGIGIGGARAMFSFVVTSRRQARQCLSRCGLARPQVPWAAFNAVKDEALKGQA